MAKHTPAPDDEAQTTVPDDPTTTAPDVVDTSAEGAPDADARAAAIGKARSVNERPARLAADDSERRTLLDDDVTMPGYVAPGDGPFDTVDPSEHASSVSPDKGAAAAAGFGVVNAVVPIPDPSGLEQALAAGEPEGEHRTEQYDVRGPDGKVFRMEHDLETGETRRL